ncbi:MAG: hypothetical protein U5L72_03010 [Bacteroidales bacterium]|nr:hypothetical protein [Bacteroidales bacterium]
MCPKSIIDTWEEANNAHWDALAIGWSPQDNKKVTGRKIPGDYEWVDQDLNDTINAYDQVVQGYLVPNTVGGLTNTLPMVDFELTVFMDYALGSYPSLTARINRAYGNVNSGVYSVLEESLTDTWQQEGDYASGNATMPRFDHQDQKQQSNYMRDYDGSIYKGDYLV